MVVVGMTGGVAVASIAAHEAIVIVTQSLGGSARRLDLFVYKPFVTAYNSTSTVRY